MSAKKPIYRDEAVLLADLKKRSEPAFTYLYEHYGPALYGVILRVVKEEETAKDALQDTFVNIYNNVIQFDSSKGRLFSWMLKIARFKAIDYYRLKPPASLSIDEPFSLQIADASSYVDFDVAEQQLAQVEGKNRIALELVFFRGYSYKEAAAYLNITAQALTGRVHFGHKMLRQLIKQAAV